MPKKWGPSEHEEFLKHILSTHKIDYQLVAKAYGSGPTAGALSQHVDKWMKSLGAKTQTTGTPNKAVVTPRKPRTTNGTSTPSKIDKTPVSAKKRKIEPMSDEDDSEPDMNGSVGGRTSLPRRSKSVASSPAMHAALDDDEEEDESDIEDGEKTDAALANTGPVKVKSRFNSVKDSDVESDISDFEKTFL